MNFIIFKCSILLIYLTSISGERISVTKCQEYCRRGNNYFYGDSLGLGPPRARKISISKCDAVDGLIIGGVPAKSAKEFPHMAALGWKNENNTVEFACGGSLISDRYVLTVAHCNKKDGKKPDLVRLGDLNHNSANEDARPKNYEIKRFIKHPLYKLRKMHHDIALIELNNTVRFTKYIKPACLQQDNDFIGNEVIATGWGRTVDRGATSDVLMKVKLNITRKLDCFDKLKDEIQAKKILSSQICAGGELKDICDGDSGGPIQVIKPDCKCTASIVGLTSFSGSIKCGSGLPAVFTRVSEYIDWIEEIVWPNATDIN